MREASRRPASLVYFRIELAPHRVAGVADLVGEALVAVGSTPLCLLVVHVVLGALADLVAGVAGLLADLVAGVAQLVLARLGAVSLAPGFLGGLLTFAVCALTSSTVGLLVDGRLHGARDTTVGERSSQLVAWGWPQC